MRSFFIYRKEDPTGISGTGIVAQGTEFDDDRVVVRWLGKTATTTLHRDRRSVEAIHCHGGKSVIVWTDDKAFKRGEVDAYQDRCENVPFSGICGKDKRDNPEAPDYIDEADRVPYLAGYQSCCLGMFGPDWKTCAFGWSHALTLNGEERGAK